MTDTSKEAAWDALMNYQQADEEGVMVLVSRQAVRECKDERDALLSERDEADRMAGAAERRNAAELADLKDCVQGQTEWLREAKAERGYSDEVSFDRVWAEVCAKADEADALRAQLQAARDAKARLPWRERDIQRGLILFRTSNNAHGYTNYSALSGKIDALPQAARDELSAIMVNMALGYSRDDVKANGVVQQWIKAARNEALEEAAAAAESLRYVEKDHWSPDYRQGGEAMNLGVCWVIRALKSTSAEGEG
jgi:hypothetical protein